MARTGESGVRVTTVDQYLAERGYPSEALVAFSGTVKDGGTTRNPPELTMNSEGESQTISEATSNSTWTRQRQIKRRQKKKRRSDYAQARLASHAVALLEPVKFRAMLGWFTAARARPPAGIVSAAPGLRPIPPEAP